MGIMKASNKVKVKRANSRGGAATNMGFNADAKDASFQYIPYGMNDTNVKDLPDEPQSPKSPAPLEISVLSHLVAGKKRVMANKSKVRRRPTLQQVDLSHPLALGQGRSLGPMSADIVEWSEVDYSVTELVRNLPPGSDLWPLLVKVTNNEECGDAADAAHWQTVGQVLQVHSCDSEQRVLAVDTQKRVFSIPINSPVHVIFRQRDKTGSSTKKHTARFNELMTSEWIHMPMVVKIIGVDSDSDDVTARNLLNTSLTLLGTITEHFLRANTIKEGWIDQGTVVVIPASSPVRLAVATGLWEATAEEWLAYRLMYSLAVRHIAFNTIRGRHNITEEMRDLLEQLPNAGATESEKGLFPIGDTLDPSPSTSASSSADRTRGRLPVTVDIENGPIYNSTMIENDYLPAPGSATENGHLHSHVSDAKKGEGHLSLSFNSTADTTLTHVTQVTEQTTPPKHALSRKSSKSRSFSSRHEQDVEYMNNIIGTESSFSPLTATESSLPVSEFHSPYANVDVSANPEYANNETVMLYVGQAYNYNAYYNEAIDVEEIIEERPRPNVSKKPSAFLGSVDVQHQYSPSTPQPVPRRRSNPHQSFSRPNSMIEDGEGVLTERSRSRTLPSVSVKDEEADSMTSLEPPPPYPGRSSDFRRADRYSGVQAPLPLDSGRIMMGGYSNRMTDSDYRARLSTEMSDVINEDIDSMFNKALQAARYSDQPIGNQQKMSRDKRTEQASSSGDSLESGERLHQGNNKINNTNNHTRPSTDYSSATATTTFTAAKVPPRLAGHRPQRSLESSMQDMHMSQHADSLSPDEYNSAPVQYSSAVDVHRRPSANQSDLPTNNPFPTEPIYSRRVPTGWNPKVDNEVNDRRQREPRRRAANHTPSFHADVIRAIAGQERDANAASMRLATAQVLQTRNDTLARIHKQQTNQQASREQPANQNSPSGSRANQEAKPNLNTRDSPSDFRIKV